MPYLRRKEREIGFHMSIADVLLLPAVLRAADAGSVAFSRGHCLPLSSKHVRRVFLNVD